MTQEYKQLLLKDLCARLPYGVKINIKNEYTLTPEDVELNPYHIAAASAAASYELEYRGLRPYLRPMSSMTEEEEDEYLKCGFRDLAESGEIVVPTHRIDFLNAHYFDFMGLIPMDLAIEAPANMYKTE